MNTTYYGHSCFELEYAGKSMLFDPFIRPNPLAAHIDVAAICPDVLLLSHGHEDHVADAVEIAQRSQAQCVSIYELHSWLLQKGIVRSHPMNIGGEWTFDDWTVRMTPALHSSSLPNGQYGGLAAGFVLSHASEPTVYFAGDTALFSDMQLIGQRSKLDLAFLPIGGNFTMNVQEAIQAAQWLKVRTVIGMHYDTFGYIGIDQNQAKSWFANAGVQLELLNIGETRTY
jgi:L-ascorbate metabolism protein UlaG (beta-lactamase superfamily)